MLVLSRRVDESIILRGKDGLEIRVMLVQARASDGRVRLGIEAPDDIEIIRDELEGQWKGRPR